MSIEGPDELDCGFPGVTCISVNGEAVHGIPGPRRLRQGDLVKLDVTAVLDGFYADACLTVPVGKANGRALSLARTAKQALAEALRVQYDQPLTEGLVMTIEPIVSADSGAVVEAGDGWTIRTADGALSAHAEHTIVITRGDPIVLTA